MARSAYVWIVQNRDSGAVIAAFTVKHECEAWLRKMSATWEVRYWTVRRVRDGHDASNLALIPARDAAEWLALA